MDLVIGGTDNLVTEQIEFVTLEHPMGEQLRQLLLHESKTIDYNMSYKTNVQASMTEWEVETKGVKLLGEWITEDILGGCYPQNKMVMCNVWFAKYAKEEYTRSHSHLPAVFSFVYFIQSPSGSSPLVFTYSKKEIEPKEGLLVLFPSVLYHHVPPNKCDDRIVLAGNISVATSIAK